MKERASIFSTTALDISDFKPKTSDAPGPRSDEIDRVSTPKFRSREPVELERSSGFIKRKPMTYRTGRNVVFSVKTTQSTVDRFYEIAQRHGWKANETFEKAMEMLARHLEA